MCVTLEDLSHRWTSCPPRATKVVVSFRKFVLPSLSWGFDSGKIKLNLGDHSARIEVERDPAFCGHLNRDVGNLCD
jgi:hypothetical protein